MTRKILVSALAVLGVLLVAAAALVPGQLRDSAVRVPADFTQETVLAGTAALLDRSSVMVPGPLRVAEGTEIRIDTTTTAASRTGADDLVVRTEAKGVTGTGTEFHSAIDVVTVDPGTRIAVAAPESTMQTPAAAAARPTPARTGTYWTFPADTPRADLPYFDTATLTPVTAGYLDADREIEGQPVLHFRFEVRDYDMAGSPANSQPARLPLPAAKWGLPGGEVLTMNLYYTLVQDMWVEPETGSVLDTVVQPTSYFAAAPGDPNRVVVYAGELRFTPETVAALARTAQDGRDSLRLVFVAVPIGVAVVGGLLVLVAAYLAVRGRRPGSGGGNAGAAPAAAAEDRPDPITAGN
ncbi:porin PorA family protein [Nocardia harenae]|uniref:porin PorA family protein n=1 Tax=Nocardia harenae TaxID=358707 RepID=UPI00082FB274|nr:porin PorA family protein [Nocardia harenae]